MLPRNAWSHGAAEISLGLGMHEAAQDSWSLLHSFRGIQSTLFAPGKSKWTCCLRDFAGEEESTFEGNLQRGWESGTPFISRQMSQPGWKYDISTPAMMITNDYQCLPFR
jgi:hypothetical protein